MQVDPHPKNETHKLVIVIAALLLGGCLIVSSRHGRFNAEPAAAAARPAVTHPDAHESRLTGLTENSRVKGQVGGWACQPTRANALAGNGADQLADSERKFRSEASLEAETVARDQVRPFLERHGFNVASDDRVTRGTAVSQALAVLDHDGNGLKIHVRLCWRRDGRNAHEREYSAAQLRARLRDNSWEETMKFLTDQDKKRGYTHTMVAQYDEDDFIYAALIPCDQMLPIWERQRDISADLIARGLTGRT